MTQLRLVIQLSESNVYVETQRIGGAEAGEVDVGPMRMTVRPSDLLA